MRAVLSAILLLHLAAPARALDDTRLAWERTDTKLHLGVAFGSSLIATEFLEWEKVPAWKATLISSLAVMAAGVIKEFAIDAFPSGSDLMANGIGVGANAAFQITFHFGGPEKAASK